jgi:hypothetical protein
MVVIDAETGEYAVDKSGIHSAIALKAKNPNARLFTIRIGYDVAVAFGGNIDPAKLIDQIETIAGISQGFEELNKGQTCPIGDFIQDMQRKYDIPNSSQSPLTIEDLENED